MNKACFVLDKHIKLHVLIQRIKKIIKTLVRSVLIHSIAEEMRQLLGEVKCE